MNRSPCAPSTTHADGRSHCPTSHAGSHARHSRRCLPHRIPAHRSHSPGELIVHDSCRLSLHLGLIDGHDTPTGRFSRSTLTRPVDTTTPTTNEHNPRPSQSLPCQAGRPPRPPVQYAARSRRRDLPACAQAGDRQRVDRQSPAQPHRHRATRPGTGRPLTSPPHTQHKLGSSPGRAPVSRVPRR